MKFKKYWQKSSYPKKGAIIGLLIFVLFWLLYYLGTNLIYFNLTLYQYFQEFIPGIYLTQLIYFGAGFSIGATAGLVAGIIAISVVIIIYITLGAIVGWIYGSANKLWLNK